MLDNLADAKQVTVAAPHMQPPDGHWPAISSAQPRRIAAKTSNIFRVVFGYLIKIGSFYFVLQSGNETLQTTKRRRATFEEVVQKKSEVISHKFPASSSSIILVMTFGHCIEENSLIRHVFF